MHEVHSHKEIATRRGGCRGPATAAAELENSEDRSSLEASTMFNGAMFSVLIGYVRREGQQEIDARWERGRGRG
jgi:hypothetical protein